MANGHGGVRPNSGRKPIEKRLSNYEKAVKMLDDNVESALKVLIDGLKDSDKNYRFRCSELILKKAIPDIIHNIKTDSGLSDEEKKEIWKNLKKYVK